MGRSFDATLKHLIQAYPQGWLRLLGLPIAERITEVDSDLSTVSPAADKVLRVEGEQPWLLQVEFQASYDVSLPGRMLVYNVLLQQRHALPVQSAVVLLRPAASGPAMTGQVLHAGIDGTTYLDFQYHVVKLWEVSPEELFVSPGTIPLAPLAAVNPQDLPGLVQRMSQELETRVEPDEYPPLWTSTFILFGLRYPSTLAKQLIRSARTMKESATYQEILEEGRLEGRQEGRQEGIVKGRLDTLRALLLELGSDRWGAPERQQQLQIAGLEDPVYLESLVRRVLKTNSWDELLKG